MFSGFGQRMSRTLPVSLDVLFQCSFIVKEASIIRDTPLLRIMNEMLNVPAV